MVNGRVKDSRLISKHRGSLCCIESEKPDGCGCSKRRCKTAAVAATFPLLCFPLISIGNGMRKGSYASSCLILVVLHEIVWDDMALQ